MNVESRWGILFLFFLLAGPMMLLGQKDTAGKADVAKTYDALIAKATTQDGFIKVHKVEDKYYLELPDTLLGRDILAVTRIARSAALLRPANGMLGYAGDQLGEKVIRFTKGSGKKIYLRRVIFSDQSRDSSQDGMFRSVMNSNLFSITAAFDIRYYGKDSSSYVIEIGDYLNGIKDDAFFDDKQWKGQFNLGALETDKSYIEGIYSYPSNTELRVVRTYAPPPNRAYHATFELNCSLIALPVEPMRPRTFDMRIGYFARVLKDFDSNPNGVEDVSMITRWRMEPGVGDEERYLKGELVPPKKPIVYYIDPATPRKWVPYLKEGVNAWQQAFEKAGFKNAIYALEAPVDDPMWSMNDAGHNVIVYKPSVVQNASGPQVSDPRTGEIMETHINWYHSVMQLLHDWYMIQAGAVDPAARKPRFDDTLMGKLIRYVCMHEMGHTLGLTHNMSASYSIPVARLRDKRWLETHSHTPSIMDYARFNYVAQPEDSIPLHSLIPRIGPYDEWAIEWGYRWLGNKRTAEEERGYLSDWLHRRVKEDKRLWYGFEGLQDPRIQAEDLGDDQMVANRYGIKNLKRIMPDIISWMSDTANPVQSYHAARLVYGRAIDQYKRYLKHVAAYIGQWYTTDKTVAEGGDIFEYVNKDKQREAVRFLQEELFRTPGWLLDTRQFGIFNDDPMAQLLKIQEELLGAIITSGRLKWLMSFEVMYPGKAYPLALYLQDLKQGIWEEVVTGKPVDIYRRNLQKLYVKKLLAFVTEPGSSTIDKQAAADYEMASQSDLGAIVKEHLRKLDKELLAAQQQTKDVMTRRHWMVVHEMITAAWSPLKKNAPLLNEAF